MCDCKQLFLCQSLEAINSQVEYSTASGQNQPRELVLLLVLIADLVISSVLIYRYHNGTNSMHACN